MSKETTTAVAGTSKKDTRKLIYEKLEAALSEYKSSLKEKRFAANLKKVSRLLANDITKGLKKKKDKVKKKKEKLKKEVLNATNGVV